MDLEQALKSALQVLDSIKMKAHELDKAQAAIEDQAEVLAAREEAVLAREVAVAPLEDAKKALAQAQELRSLIEADRKALTEERVAFENFLVTERQKLNDEEAALLPLKEQANQVRQDKIALEAEKKSYKEKIKNELLNQLKSGKL